MTKTKKPEWEKRFDEKWSSWIIDYLSGGATDDVLKLVSDKEKIKEQFIAFIHDLFSQMAEEMIGSKSMNSKDEYEELFDVGYNQKRQEIIKIAAEYGYKGE